MAIPISYNLRNLRVRKATTVMTALGISLTVAVLLGIAALVGGLRSSLEVTGHPLHLIVMQIDAAAPHRHDEFYNNSCAIAPLAGDR